MKNINLENFISKNREQYIEKALMFSKDRETLNKIREKIFKNLKISPLFDTKNFTQKFGEALLKIYNS